MNAKQKELLDKIVQTGEISVEDADDANVPVNIFIVAPEDNEDGQAWRCYADNFCPRKTSVYQSAYDFAGPDKETCQAVVKEFFLPIYKAAVQQLEENGDLYYWEVEKKEKEKA